MNVQEHISLKGKTTMRIGGTAHYYAELASKQDIEEAARFTSEHKVPLVVLGGGANTIFANGEIEALVVRITANTVQISKSHVTAEAGKNLAMLVNELAEKNLDLSPLTGIPGSVGGAVFGNAGQGPTSTWIGSFVDSVTVYVDGKWREFSRKECDFGYRDSVFKRLKAPVIWSAALSVPTRPVAEIKAEIEHLLQKRFKTQPHTKTAGSCFKAAGNLPAWKLIDAAGLRGLKIGGVEVSDRHANFLLNTGEATFEDATAIVWKIRNAVKQPLDVEMRFIQNNGSTLF